MIKLLWTGETRRNSRYTPVPLHWTMKKKCERLHFNGVQFVWSLSTFRWKIKPPSSGSNSKLYTEPGRNMHFYGGQMLLRNVSVLLPKYNAVTTRRSRSFSIKNLTRRTHDWTRASAVRSQHLTSWAVTSPLITSVFFCTGAMALWYKLSSFLS
jgi:hypothetical protein